MSPHLPLSYSQRIIWAAEERQPGTAISTLAGVINRPPLDVKLFENAAQAFAKQTPWLGMRIHLDAEGIPVQSWVPEKSPFVDVITVASFGDAQARVMELARERFEMYNSRLFRLTVLNYPGGSSFLARGHHILFDGTALLAVFNGILAEYDNLRIGVQRLPQSGSDYAEYIDEEATYLESSRFQRDERYWDDTFATIPEATGLREDISGVGMTRRLVFEMPDELAATLASSQKTIGHSRLTAVLGLFAAYVAELTGASDVSLATSVLGRSRRFERCVGMFANVVPVRLRLDRDASVAVHLDFVRDALFSVLRHSRYPQELITERYHERTGATGSLFDINVTYQDAALTVNGEEGEFDYQWLPYAARSSSLEVNLTRRLADEPFHLVVDYRLDAFKEHEINTLMTRFVAYLNRALADLTRPLRSLSLCTDDELDTVKRWSEGPALTFAHDNVVSAFREAVRRWPEAPAILEDSQSFTYHEVDKRSDAVARLLRSHGVGTDVVVPLLARRSAELLVWLLGIAKAGGACLPLDVDSPADRIAYILRDCGALVVCRDPDVVVEHTGVVLDISSSTYAGLEAAPFEDVPGSGQLAYVIYTSGSTGRPKGVMVEHGAITNRLEWMCQHVELGPGDVFLFKSPYVFDVSVVEVFCWFFVGARVVVLESGAEREPARILDLVEREKVTYAHFVPSMLGAFLDYVEAAGAGERLSSLRNVVASGEVLQPRQVSTFKANLLGTRLHNFYGPTEAAVEVTAFDCSAVACENWPDVPIGAPIANTFLYVVTSSGTLAPPGIPGELLIGGANVGRGYLNQSELTTRSFAVDHFRGGEGRLYRTGDTVFWRPDGVLSYIGRKDGQVKIRGHRVELSESERQLQGLSGIEQAVVVAPAEADGCRSLVAFIVLTSGATVGEVEEAARQVLPEYMMPMLFLVDEIPLTGSGKIDRRRLAEQASVVSAGRSVPHKIGGPIDVAEGEAQKLAEAWCEVLNLPRVQGDDSFFALGGDSIKAIRVVTRLRAQGLRLEVRDFMEAPVFNCLAERIGTIDHGASERTPGGVIRPLPIQAQFLRHGDDAAAIYNQYVLLELSQPVPPERFVAALESVLAAHEVFSLRFRAGAEPQAIGATSIGGSRLRTRTTSETLTASNIIGTFIDAQAGPLVDVLYSDTPLVDRVLVQVHHLAIDVVSWHLVLSELSARLCSPAEPTIIDRGLAEWCDHFYEDANLAEARLELPHWRRVAEVGPRPVRHGAESRSVHRSLDAQTSAELLRLRDEEIFRPEEILTAAVAAAVGRHYGVDFHGQVESHGRHPLPASGVPASSDAVGWFTCRFPLGVLPGGELDSDALWRARQAMQETPGHGLGYGLLVEAEELSVGAEPTFVLNYVGEVGYDTSGGRPLAFRVLSSGLFDGRQPTEPSVHINAGTNQGIFFIEVKAVAVADPADIEVFADRIVGSLGDCAKTARGDQLATAIAGASVNANAEDLQAVLSQILG